MNQAHAVVMTAAVALVACGVPQEGALNLDAGAEVFDAGSREVDAGALDDGGVGGPVAMYPGWQLEDVQPQSARFGQTYGLSAFSGRPVVVVLLEGF